ncbi:MAG TPA: pteridine reductase [Chiayiivirga sp.]|jgi:pteridine reductase|uniref:Pteridine reductase n=1 Tax=Denitratimonas tolerans TaxID=1338420 RepID=A0AAW9R4U5_9GAMM|nr:pteridine reductase [Xanthomonadaceae bacterium]MDX9765387.1 pteridine reductase [Chiayiivirga sp.]MEB2315169.1 pteridine reductase [Xanthomonadaceae bacterium]HRN60297.1 pteridine reductase [Chiayiivirga sp.]HRO88494.1 pteridine reductase [Chiayiivirga sp.]
MTTPRPVALVTGAARRIGAAIATALHAAGYDLALHFHRSASEASALQDALEARRRHSTALLQADLSDTARLPSLVERTVVRFGRLDALVNNASAFFPTPIGESTEAMWDALMGANAKAPFFLSQAAAFYLRESRGAILNLSDVYAERPRERHAVYCMSKAALSMMTLALARELAPEVRVNAIAPGAILWPEAGDDPELRASVIARTALGRTGTAAEIAEAAVFLVDAASYTTGQVLRVDGGRWLEI